jgi:hypothetical protein
LRPQEILQRLAARAPIKEGADRGLVLGGYGIVLIQLERKSIEAEDEFYDPPRFCFGMSDTGISQTGRPGLQQAVYRHGWMDEERCVNVVR